MNRLQQAQGLLESRKVVEIAREVDDGYSRTETPFSILEVFIQAGLVKSKNSFNKNPLLLKIDGVVAEASESWPQEKHKAVLIAGKKNPIFCNIISDVAMIDLLENVFRKELEGL